MTVLQRGKEDAERHVVASQGRSAVLRVVNAASESSVRYRDVALGADTASDRRHWHAGAIGGGPHVHHERLE
jgi:hypothetical protein